MMPVVTNITPACPSNYGPGGSGKPCTSNVTTWTAPSVLTNAKVVKEYINELRTAINREINRRIGTIYDFSTAISGTSILAEDVSNIRSVIDNRFIKYTTTGEPNGLKTFTWTYVLPSVSSAVVGNNIVEEVRNKINEAETDCLCNCNYCTCNCNYCTCNCNYCTCNCNYCTCNCNHACTCNCNYR